MMAKYDILYSYRVFPIVWKKRIESITIEEVSTCDWNTFKEEIKRQYPKRMLIKLAQANSIIETYTPSSRSR